MMISMRRGSTAFAACIALLTFASAADAGPPLICHPIDAGDAELLPWGEVAGWHSPDPGYDVASVVDDTLRLLTPAAPLLARMENLRRATIYAAEEPQLATELLAALLERAKGGPEDALAWFDAGYLIETYRQAGIAHVGLGPLLVGVDAPSTPYAELNALDGYQMLGLLLERDVASAEIELARARMALDNATARGHWQRAAALTPRGTLLAENLAAYAY